MSVTPVTLPPGRAMLATPTVPTPSPLTAMTIGRVEVFRLAATSAGPDHDHQDVDLAVDQLLGKAVEPIVAAFRPSLFKLDVPALGIAEIAEPLP